MSTIRSNTKALLSYRDLVEVYNKKGLEASQFVANALGLTYNDPADSKSTGPIVSVESFEFDVSTPAPVDGQPSDSQGYPSQIEYVALWLPTQFSLCDQNPRDAEKEAFQLQQEHWDGIWWRNAPAAPLPFEPLAPWSVLKGRIEKLTQEKRSSRTVDSVKLVSNIANGYVIAQVPRTEKSCSGQLVIVLDGSQRLTPFHEDNAYILSQLKRERPNGSIQIISISSSEQDEYSERMTLEVPSDTSTVLICGDLGLLATTSSCQAAWLDWGRRASASGTKLAAVVPFGLGLVPPTFREVFHIESMQADQNACIEANSLRREMLRTMFVLASPSSSVSARLLRALRRLLPMAIDASLESAFWQDSRLWSRHSEGATIHTDIVQQELMPEFERLDQVDRELQQSAMTLIREYHTEMHPTMWLQSYLSLSPSLQSLLPKSDRADAVAAIQRIVHLGKSQDNQGQEMECFMDRSLDTFTVHATIDPEVGKIIHQAWADLRPNDPSKFAFRDPSDLPKTKKSVCAVSVTDQTVIVERIVASGKVDLQSGYPICSSSEGFQIELSLAKNRLLEPSFWKAGGKPDFVSAFGRDQYGAWFEFQVSGRDTQNVVTQRMRWIRAGTFTMGSPDDEPERRDNEVLHQVTLTRGFWLADTACTQALWGAVMGVNQSQFQGDERPVEKVSYDDVVKFCSSLGKQIPGLMPQMPTEAQWEYACRAGTQTTFSFGSTISTDQANFDGNYPYNGSPKGLSRRETLSVKDLPANPWGLYQMHGNVWEWCSDWYTDSLSESQIDPIGPSEGSYRVLRGGGWFGNARYVRSACRFWFGPGLRNDVLGVRLLSSAGAEPSEMAEGPVAEQGSEPARLGAADEFFREFRVRVGDQEPAELEIAQATTIRVVSNLEAVELQRLTKPDWAVEFGRDVYGVYGDFELESAKDHSMVQQRLRWIPPGRFQMGSPPEEPGRFPNEDLKDVTISDGFWMFDAPCSQRLWTAIMDDNPSHFLDAERPVESVDWAQAKEFAARLNQALKAHVFQLPTEAQWEYACRAGTSTAIYTGTLEIIGDANAPALDPIAWYVGNSGHKYDLEQSEDIAKYGWLSKKQFPFTHAGTRKIKQKAPNPWGLYDMLGNVWEWCEDWYSEKLEGSSVDPRGPETGSVRVIRGGSLISFARFVRSACRNRLDPGDRYNDLGFRLLSSASPGPVAERVVGSRRIPRDEAGENQRTK